MYKLPDNILNKTISLFTEFCLEKIVPVLETGLIHAYIVKIGGNVIESAAMFI